MERRLDAMNILAIYIDCIIVDGHHILAALGVDDEGKKPLVGLAQGASENARVIKEKKPSPSTGSASPPRSCVACVPPTSSRIRTEQ